MSIIAIRDIPYKVSLDFMGKVLRKSIDGHFQPLNFETGKGGKKTCYIRLSDKLDPLAVIENINTTQQTSHRLAKIYAFIPRHVPDLPIAKPKKKAVKKRFRDDYQRDGPSNDVLEMVHYQILVEMQSKYLRLFDLSNKNGHALLENLAQTVFNRLKAMVEVNVTADKKNYFLFSKLYRKLHPHFGDFQLILSTLHATEDAAAQVRSQISEQDLIGEEVLKGSLLIDNIPYKKLSVACNKYSDRITNKMIEHINNLDLEVGSGSADDKARRRIRQELKNFSQHLPLMIKQVVTYHFIPQKSTFRRVRIYGEPFLPSKEQLFPVIRKLSALKVQRSNRMYNLLLLNVPVQHYQHAMTMDGTVVSGAKLVVRPSDIPIYKMSDSLKAEMQAFNKSLQNFAPH